MGFFSSRRAEQLEDRIPDNSTVVRVIRSRFYGSGKARETSQGSDEGSYNDGSPPSVSASAIPRDRTAVTRQVPQSTARHDVGTSPKRVRGSVSHSPLSRPAMTMTDDEGTHSATDVITITLAQRLNELATANSEGLLNDDEYRLLRQNLFERLASSSTVPSEAPLVRLTGMSPSVGDGRTSISSSHQRRPSSNFQVQTSRPSSVQSKKSMSSTVTGLLRRATSKRTPSDASDTTSIYSATSSTPERHTFPRFSRVLSKQTSARSLQSDHTYVGHRSEPIIPVRGHGSSGLLSEISSSATSIRSSRRGGSTAPPSAFPNAAAALIDAVVDDDQPESVKDIRQQIDAVEAEGRRLLDAFNGLELTTLTSRHRWPNLPPSLPQTPIRERHRQDPPLTPERRSVWSSKDDAMSVKSNGSVRTTLSSKRSPSTKGRSAPSALLVSQPVTLSRKNSLSSMSSRSRNGPSTSTSIPPVPSLSGRLFASTSSVNLARSTGHLPLATVVENESRSPRKSPGRHLEINANAASSTSIGISLGTSHTSEDEDIIAMESELVDIRRRREEVTARYDARLEYLRARLKGAELREKLLKR